MDKAAAKYQEFGMGAARPVQGGDLYGTALGRKIHKGDGSAGL